MTNEEMAITNDLIVKVAEDVSAALKRTLAIAPEPARLAIMMSAGMPILAGMAHVIDPKAKECKRDTLMFCGLLLSRVGKDSMDEAARDIATLIAAGRVAEGDLIPSYEKFKKQEEG